MEGKDSLRMLAYDQSKLSISSSTSTYEQVTDNKVSYLIQSLHVSPVI